MPAPTLGLTARATINRIVDGDTVDVICLGMPVRVRLLGCWAPEVRGEESPEGKEAKAFLQTIAPVDAHCVVSIDTSHARKLSDLFTFGRIVGHIWLNGAEQNLSEIMIEAGHATPEKRA